MSYPKPWKSFADQLDQLIGRAEANYQGLFASQAKLA